MDICALILSYLPQLTHFNSREYPPAFEDFACKASEFFDSLVPDEMETRVSDVIEGLETRRKALSPRKARNQAEEEKMALTLFLAPAALQRGGPAQQFAGELSRQWNARYPRNSFYPGEYAEIMEGFQPRIFGIPLRK